MNSDQYSALWRSSAHEAVPYTEDFPEPLLVFPEVIDGSLGQGKATEISIRIVINEATRIGVMTVTDNGIGIANERRLLQWAAKEATDNMHRNGHGLKKNLTKWHSDYATAKWKIKYRKRGKNLQVISAPFLGPDTLVDEIEFDEETLMPHGTSVEYEFAVDILGNRMNPKILYYNIREIVRTRYSNDKLSAVKINLEISSGDLKLSDNSHIDGTLKWKSFQQTVKESGIVDTLLDNHRVEIDGGYWVLDLYRININGNETPMRRLNAQAEFPTYGNKNMNSSRVHISLDGRMIEAIPVWKLVAGRESNHNDFNGVIGFVNFVPNSPDDFHKMPIPCTTKVSFYEPGDVFKRFTANVGKVIHSSIKSMPPPTPKARVRVPAPAPAPAPVPPPMSRQSSVRPSAVKNKTEEEERAERKKELAKRKKEEEDFDRDDDDEQPATGPTPANSPILTFRQTTSAIQVLENNNILYAIPYKSNYKTTEEYYKQTLEQIGIERFKKWAVEQERVNQQLN